MEIGYGFYTETYGGSNITESAWTRLSQKASQRLEHFTFGRLPEDWAGAPWESRAKCAICEMAETILAEENRAGKTSENTDGYSVSFDTSQSVDSLLYKIAYVYLGSTGLMDFGVDE